MHTDNTQLLNVAHVEPSTELEGPGWRFALWVQGCPLGCHGCCNPEMQPDTPKRWLTVEALLAEIPKGVEGISLLGGEPFAQARAIGCFAKAARTRGLSVVTFTGYTLEELKALGDPEVELLLDNTDLLIDGRYQVARHSIQRRFVGSDNQRFHFLTSRYSPAHPAFSSPNQVELTLGADGTLHVVGYPLALLTK